MELRPPASLRREHEELHAGLAETIKAGGNTGNAAKKVADILHAHFLKEEEYALPPLGMLPVLAEGTVLPEMQAVIELTDRLKADLGHMLKEHEEIVTALKSLIRAAEGEGNEKAVIFAEKLMLHAQTEEDVLYPASILIGEYLKLKLSRRLISQN
ncbi:MAG TPA: hemerythrin domain-containing protein [Methanothrix sp.]|jgi:hypothetical protein|uniref:hemerythrin domain-containing protein n=1 Tax=Methanothrix sp. TaxID=90426 RepID=UPI002BEE2926|nr:hemerythrin domain-containing protein [Methanothrix sp.]MDI9416877.1 hemerythrin domain-containing protein [Euryarchaeota archaeon]HON35722.1 hemerythrin domain-containing protein [Methanothrix sp.]HRU75052.1 hemerythrin domain-containing protein [Methanothrix sp.]